MEKDQKVLKIRSYGATPTIAIPQHILDQLGHVRNFSVSVQKDLSGCPCIVYRPIFAAEYGCAICDGGKS